ncbi:hypothetical protein Peur_024047 [Populus x canadensis]
MASLQISSTSKSKLLQPTVSIISLVKVQNVLDLLWSIHFEKKIRVDHHVILHFLVKIYLISRTKDIIIIFFLYSLVAQESNSAFLVILFERRKVLSQSSITLRKHH